MTIDLRLAEAFLRRVLAVEAPLEVEMALDRFGNAGIGSEMLLEELNRVQWEMALEQLQNAPLPVLLCHLLMSLHLDGQACDT